MVKAELGKPSEFKWTFATIFLGNKHPRPRKSKSIRVIKLHELAKKYRVKRIPFVPWHK